MDLGGNDGKGNDAMTGHYRNSFLTVFLIEVTANSVFSAYTRAPKHKKSTNLNE
jgi:hypothetical protein